MRRSLISSIAYLAVVLFVTSLVADAQAQSGRGITSRNSRTTSRQSMQSNTSARGQQLPYSGGGLRGQQGGFGQNGGGIGTGPAAGMAGQAGGGQGPMATGLAQGAAERFQEGGFVGRDANDVRAGFDSLSGGRGPGQMMDMMVENLNEMRESRRRWREQNSAPPPIRVRLEPAFDLPVAPPLAASREAQARLTRIMQRQGVGSPGVQIAGGVAVIRGSVTTERDRALLAQIAALEPGVNRVENRLTIATPPPAPPQ